MTTFHCIDTAYKYDVTLAREASAFIATTDLMLSCAGTSGLDGFIVTSGSDEFPAHCEGDIITTQVWFDNFISALRAEAELANVGKSLRLPYPGNWKWYVEIENSGTDYFDFSYVEFSVPQLEYLFRHTAPWPDELIEELVDRAGLDYSECEEGTEDYWGVWRAAAEKLGIDTRMF